jgi:PDZ domain
VIKPVDGGPAARAGVMAEDLITAIGDEPIKSQTLEAAFRRISGPVNATIKLKIIRQKQTDPLVFAFAREAVPSHSVELQVRVADGKLVVEATGRWPILDSTRASRRPWRFSRAMNSTSRVAITRGSPSFATQLAKSTARFSIREHGSNAVRSPNRRHTDR